MPVELTRPYCTLAQVQDETRNTDESDTELFHRAINEASRFVEQHCRADFWYHDHRSSLLTVPSRWVAGATIYFPWPIITLTKLEDISADTAVELPTTDWKLEKGITDQGVVESRGKLTYSFKLPVLTYKDTLRVTGHFGCTLAGEDADETDAPPINLPIAVNRACTLIAAALSGRYNKQWKEPGGAVQETLQTNIPKEAYTLLARWKRPQSS